MVRRGADIEKILKAIRAAVGKEEPPAVSRIARRRRDPFKILVSTILSLRTKDEVTSAASGRLFSIASTPREMASLDVRRIEKAIYPVGFYKRKAGTVKEIAARIVECHGSRVPDSLETLLRFKGVGRKTANLVLTLGYGKDGICVDTHVHRVSNRLGLVCTKDPEKTEFALMKVLPKRHWIGYNELLVTFGKEICKPISPLCTRCPLSKICPKVDVEKHR